VELQTRRRLVGRLIAELAAEVEALREHQEESAGALDSEAAIRAHVADTLAALGGIGQRLRAIDALACPRCAARMTGGHRCRNRAVHMADYCRQHRPV